MRLADASILLCAILLSACRSTSVASLEVEDYAGISYDIRGTGLDFEAEAGRVRATSGGHVLEVQGGELILDGQHAGTVESGDHVRLDGDGSLRVNGERRR